MITVPPRLLEPGRLARAGTAVAIGMTVAVVIVLITSQGVETVAGGRLGGDFPAFYAAGELARRDLGLLLDPAAQAAAQAPYLNAAWAPFPYPPAVAYAFVPLAWLPFTAAYTVYVVLLAGAAVLAVRLVLDILGVVDPRWRTVAYLGALTFAPTFRSVGGAQNATVTLLILAGTVRVLQRERPEAAGLVLGLLWFKPQYAIPAIGLLLATRTWRRAGLVSLVPGVALWTVTALALSAGWVTTWWDHVIRVTSAGNQRFNTSLTVSVVEYLRGVLPSGLREPVGVGVALALGLVFAVAVRRVRAERALLALICGALLVTSLHALPYELVLLVPLIGLALVESKRDGVATAVGVYLAGWAVIVGFTHPLVRFAYVAGVIWWAALAWDDARGVPASGRPGHA